MREEEYSMDEMNRVSGGSMESKTYLFDDDDLLVSAVLTNKTFKCAKKCPPQNKKVLKRTVLSWLLHSGVVCLNEVIHFQSLKDDAKVKEGLITSDGILCLCCEKQLTFTNFKNHSGFTGKQPCMNLFLESGKPLILCMLEAWSAEYLARKAPLEKGRVFQMDENDNICGLCGNLGDLICCDNCPSAFHQTCMLEQELPEGSWYCLQCRCLTCGELINDKDPPPCLGAQKCSLCMQKYHDTCKQGEIMDGGSSSEIWFCAQSCRKIYLDLQSRIGLVNHLNKDFYWTLLKCIDGDCRAHSSQHFVALKAECNSKLAVAITLMEECFSPMKDELTKINMIPQAMYNWGSQLARLDCNQFYTIILEKEDVVLSVASIRIHGIKVAELPFIATCGKHRGQGLCRILVDSIQEMLRSLKVEKLLVAAESSVVNMWMKSFHFQHLEEDERQYFKKFNLMLLPGSTWLKKSL